MPATPPSSNWVTPDSLDTGGNRSHEQIHAVLEAANFKYLQEVALLSRKARDENAPKGITCTINPKSFTCGMNNLVLKVAFSDNVYWIARVQHSPVDSSHAREHTLDMLSEIATMKTLHSRTSIPVPMVFDFDTSPSNEFGFPYILMECLNGQILDSTIARQVPAEYLQHVARQLAEVLFQLENLTFDHLGRLWCGENCDEPPRIIPCEQGNEATTTPRTQTSLEWFFELRQDENRRALETHADDPEWRTACWILKTAISHFIIEDRLHGPFPLCHFDLHYGNLLFDDEYNLTGVIDWSQSATAPLERLAVSPEFITFPALPDEKNQIILDFREATRHCLQELVNRAQRSSPAVERKTTLSMILGSKQADITHRCTYSRPHRALWDGRLVSSLIYGANISWEQLVAVYGEVQLH
ncbi:Aminoglycoside phosphotransferase [Cordyceps fumosorosea ARSEF 2679]|uniref:Aminoglycoside phosphotransferase n=1 Tax=Cordyceps fumosorosea (strain ARSEF 2679) TaxID=1081104 RepID=A0A167NE94_CORFA|nr:Aminoglycoside phosphotransferase [Cordyceps fumosorosea ARSEF 2679]OAA55463.1 Aminoglycoside phosphotransferase [Cordyceps fumosorosea ARSEF 2679]